MKIQYLIIGLFLFMARTTEAAIPITWCYGNSYAYGCEYTPEQVCQNARFYINSTDSICKRTYLGISEYNQSGPSKALCAIEHDGFDGDCSNGNDWEHGSAVHEIWISKSCPGGYVWSSQFQNCRKCDGKIEEGQCLEQPNLCPSTANPISLATGYKFINNTVYDETKTNGLKFEAYYRHKPNRYHTDIFNFWSWDYTQAFKLVKTPNGMVGVLTRPSGLEYFYNPTDDEYQSFQASLNGDTTLVSKSQIESDEYYWSIILPNGKKEIFNKNGRLSRIINVDGVTLNISYVVNDNDEIKSLKVESSKGAELNVEYVEPYKGIGSKSRNFTLELPGEKKYDYNFISNEEESYAEIVGPYSESEYSTESSKLRYNMLSYPRINSVYTDRRNGAISSIYKDGFLIRRYEYDASSGRAIRSEAANGLDRKDIDYITDNKGNIKTTTVENALGKSEILHFIMVNGINTISRVEGIATAQCVASNSFYTYTDKGEQKTLTNENGDVIDTIRNYRGLIETSTTAMQWTDGVDSTLVTTPESQRTLTTWLPSVNKIDTQTSQQLLADDTWQSYRVVDYDWLNERHIKKITVTDPRDATKIQVTDYSYTFHDGDDIIIDTLTIDGPRTDISDVVSYQYNNLGQLIKFTNALGQETEYLNYTPSGLVQTIVDANGVTTSLTYNVKQLVETVTQVHPSGDVSKNRTTALTYTFDDQVERITSTDGTFIEYEYDAARRLDAIVDTQGNRMEYDLDAAGNIEGETIKNTLGEVKYSLIKRYDELSRLRKVIQNFGQETDYNYDVANNLEGTINGRDYPTTYDVDALNRITSIFDAQNNETKMAYTADDVIKKVTDARGLETVYDYDVLGNLLSLTSPDTGLTSYTYDNAGNLKTITDNKGLVQTYTYDALNRVTSISYSNGEAGISYGYDDTTNDNYGMGKLTSITDASGTTAYSYNFAGQLIDKAYSIASLATETEAGEGSNSSSINNYNLHYGYDNYGRFNTVTYPSGRIVTYHYDIAGQIASITTQEDISAAPQTVINSITYLPFGPVESFIYGNGVQRLFHYDLDYKLESIATQGNSVLMDRTYLYDLNNNIKDIVDNTSQISELFTYDFLDRLDTANGTYGVMDYDYDTVGNRTQRIATNDTDITTEVYTPSTTSNQLDTITITQNGNTSTRDFGYDLNGNLDTDFTTGQNANQNITFTNNASNRPVSWSDGQTAVQTSYNALGQRTVKLTSEKEEYFHYNETGKLIAVSSNGEYVKEFIYFGSEVVAILAQDNQENANTETQNFTTNSALLNNTRANKHLTQNALAH